MRQDRDGFKCSRCGEAIWFFGKPARWRGAGQTPHVCPDFLTPTPCPSENDWPELKETLKRLGVIQSPTPKKVVKGRELPL